MTEVQPLRRGEQMSETAAVAPAPAAAPAPSAPATSTPAPAPASATATPTPAAETKPTPSRNLTARELLDNIPLKTKAEPKGEPKEAPSAAAPEEKPATPEIPTTVSEAAKGEEAKAAEPEKPEPTEETFDPETYAQEEIDQKAIADALNAIPDKKVRDRLKYDRRVAKLVTRPYSEQKELNSLFPATQMARDAVAYRDAYDNLSGAFNSGSPEGIRYVIAEMAKTNPHSFKGFVREIVPHLQKIDPEAFLVPAQAAARNGVNYLRQLAEREGDPDLKTAADIFEERVLGTANPQPPQRAPQQPHPAEAQLRALQQRELEHREAALGNFRNHADGIVIQALQKEASDLVAKSDPDGLYPEDAKAELRDEIRDATLAALDQNPQFVRYVEDLIRNGQLDPDHVKRVVEAKLQTARMHLREIGPQRIEKYARRFTTVQNNRVQRQSEIASRRDVGGSGAVASAPPPPKPDTRGKNVRELLDLIPIPAALRQRA